MLLFGASEDARSILLIRMQCILLLIREMQFKNTLELISHLADCAITLFNFFHSLDKDVLSSIADGNIKECILYGGKCGDI